jgi:hypothetical protein
MRFVAIVASCVALASCGLYQRQQLQEAFATAKAQQEAAMAECIAKYPPGGKQYIEKAQCQNNAMNILRPFMPYPDLLDQDMASRMAIAEKLQQGKFTLAEANLQQSQAHSQIVAEEQRRQLSGRAVSAQESAAAAAWRASAPVSCTRVGNTTSCY